MAGRIYTVSFADVAVTAVQDMIAIYTGATKAVKIHSVTLGQKTATAVGNLSITLKRLPATVTAGSGGAAGTVVATNPGDAAATVTARTNDTTQATTSGSAAILAADDYNVINGYLFMPPETDRPVIGLSSAFIVSLNTAPSSSETMSGTVTLEELF